MQRLLQLLYYYRAFLLFFIIEAFCFFLIYQNNAYQRALILNSSNSTVASIVNLSRNIENYFKLNKINRELSEELTKLEFELEQYKKTRLPAVSDTLVEDRDSLEIEYIFESAKIINNSTSWSNNTLTINKGSEDGINTGMGVIGGGGIVGQTRYVSNNFSVITSLLHTELQVSAKVANKIEFSTIEWDGRNYRKAKLRFIPRHYPIDVGDSVLTSGYNSIFPPDILIGFVESVELGEDATFLDIEVELANDFKNLSYVSVIKNVNRVEKDSLESLIQKDEL